MSRRFLIPISLILLNMKALSADNEARGSGTPPNTAPGQCQMVAILHNGLTMEHTRHEVMGSSTRLWMCGGTNAGYVEIPSEQIEGFERRPSAVPRLSLATASAPEANANGHPPG